MSSRTVTDPGVVARADVDDREPTPTDCLNPSETPRTTVDLSPGWIAVTDRELLVYHPDRDPPVGRTLLANVTGLVVRRAGGRGLVGYAPIGTLYAVGAIATGLLLQSVDPTGFLTVPQGTVADSFRTIVDALGWATTLLGVVLVFTGVLAAFCVVVLAGYWLVSTDVVLVVERGGADPVECPTTRPAGQRAVRSLEPVFGDVGSETDRDTPGPAAFEVE